MLGRGIVHYSRKGEGSFCSVLPKSLTIDKALYTGVDDYSHRTLFKEVKIRPYIETGETLEFLSEIKEVKPVAYIGIDWVKKIFDSFCQTVEKYWYKKPIKIISHSSGWDSRLISLAIIKLGLNDENVLFCESKGEFLGFEKIMNVLKIKNYKIYGKEIPPSKHSYSYVLDAADAFEGVVGYPLNEFYTPYKEYLSQEDQIIHFTGYGANGITDGMKDIRTYYSRREYGDKSLPMCEKLRRLLRWLYYIHLNKFKMIGEGICLFWDFDFLKTIAAIKNWQGMKERFSEVIVKAIEPKLAAIKRISIPDLVGRGYRTFDDESMQSLLKQYGDTWYGKHIKSNPTKELSYCQWWADWTAALICEKLIGQGYEVNLELDKS